eukprot:TRINITY_DN6095_c0_g1_i2.p1 TRINITY_DN6095_c0_g1~~TRINITY_DN6095_c0_g1_i2.p1  ORF type:complete len:616 (+),score=141.75 TRINITY_DN6095_c0_g1_i2:38-1885(+)
MISAAVILALVVAFVSAQNNCTLQTTCFSCISSEDSSGVGCAWCGSSELCVSSNSTQCTDELIAVDGKNGGGLKCPELERFSLVAFLVPLAAFVVLFVPIFVLTMKAKRPDWRENATKKKLLCCGVNCILAGLGAVALAAGGAYLTITFAYAQGTVSASGAYVSVAFCSIALIVAIITLTCGSCYIDVYNERKPRTQCEKCGHVNGLQDHCSNCGNLIGGARDFLKQRELKEYLPWDFSGNKEPGWENKDGYRAFKICENGTVFSQQLNEKLTRLWQDHFGGRQFTILKAYAIDNGGLRQGFDEKIVRIHNQMEGDPDIYARQDWLDNLTKCKIMEALSDRGHKFDHNKTISPPVIPMLQGLSNPDLCWDLCKYKFSELSTIEDGYYGKGMYFTSSAEYAVNLYSRLDNRVLLISFVTPGNPNPCTENPNIPRESLIGRVIKQGYDSHYALVDGSGLPLDVRNSKVGGKLSDYDELVIDDEQQVLPCYLVFLGRGKRPTLTKAKIELTQNMLEEMEVAREEENKQEEIRNKSFQLEGRAVPPQRKPPPKRALPSPGPLNNIPLRVVNPAESRSSMMSSTGSVGGRGPASPGTNRRALPVTPPPRKEEDDFVQVDY